MTIVVALGISAAGFAVLVRVFDVTGDTSTAAPPTTATVDCTATEPLSVPDVALQRDGLHLRITRDPEVPIDVQLRMREGGGNTVTIEFERGGDRVSTQVILAPEGVGEIVCANRDRQTGETIAETTSAIHIADPDDVWRDPSLDCGSEIHESNLDRSRLFFYADVNPVADGIARILPGVLRTDVVQEAGFDFDSQVIVVRDDQVVAVMDAPTYGRRTFIGFLMVCNGAGIGEEGQPTAGMAATPFTVDGFERCDPYATTCQQVYVSAAWLAERGTPVPRAELIPEPESVCQRKQPEGCTAPPDEVVVRVQLSVDDAEAFAARFGCGDDPASACG